MSLATRSDVTLPESNKHTSIVPSFLHQCMPVLNVPSQHLTIESNGPFATKTIQETCELKQEVRHELT